jgi:hypothetical protein
MRRAAAAAPVPALRWPYSSPPPTCEALEGGCRTSRAAQPRFKAAQRRQQEARARAGRAGVTFLGHGLGVPAAAGAAGLRRRSCLPFARFASFASRQFRLAQQPPQTPQSIVPIHRPSDIRRYRCRPAKTTFGARGSRECIVDVHILGPRATAPQRSSRRWWLEPPRVAEAWGRRPRNSTV